MPDDLERCYLAAIRAVRDGGPRALHRRARFEAAEMGSLQDVGLSALTTRLETASPNDGIRYQLHLAVAAWDAAPVDSSWANMTEPGTRERRQVIYRGLELTDEAASAFDEIFPVHIDGSVIISDTFEPWYDEDRRSMPSFYWPAYRGYLANVRNWNADAVAELDSTTTEIVSRLADPLRPEAYQSRGLVVGYVQSGKTANFNGVIAKAVDAGYRLIILMTGTVSILREQTQRRIDMEVVGTENIRRMVEADDPEVDYADDPAWIEGRFNTHGFLPSSQNLPDIFRLTTRNFDYKRLKQGITALEFERVDRTRPLYDKTNLYRCAARLIVVKKNSAILTKLVADLRHIKDRHNEIPALIIDDESDLASVNTSNPKKWLTPNPQRTAINAHISNLLKTLPRAQYIGYTATPFANVFIDPSDAEDIFPKDFLLSLGRPIGYMGIADFHDLDSPIDPEDRTIENSNEKRHVRNLVKDAADSEDELREAVDAFVLSGAIKLYREAQGLPPSEFRHHTMLVHQSTYRNEHRVLADLIKDLWAKSGYSSGSGQKRLRTLFENDFLPVSEVLENETGLAIPPTYAALSPYVGAAISRMTPNRAHPVIVVNSDTDIDQENLDFDTRPIWRILVGGAKLSRGFTVEGLTISYYRRAMRQADSLMQAGRWFGFRNGYRDLVRLYIGRREPFGRMTTDLYQDFEAILKVEEDFREELRRYKGSVNGRPQLTPQEIPPLVHQYVPWLHPTSPNKMFNARLTMRRSPGIPREPVAYPDDDKSKARNYELLVPLLVAASTPVRLAIPIGGGTSYEALIGEVPHKDLLEAMRGLLWSEPDYFQPDLASLEEIRDDAEVAWAVIAPQLGARGMERTLPGVGLRTLVERGRREGRGPLFGGISDPKHRPAALRLAGATEGYGDPEVERRRRPHLGAVMLYPMVEDPLTPRRSNDEIEASKVIVAFVLIAPNDVNNTGAQPYVSFTVENKSRARSPIVPIRP